MAARHAGMLQAHLNLCSEGSEKALGPEQQEERDSVPSPVQECTEEWDCAEGCWEIGAASEGWLARRTVDQPGWGWRQEGLRFRMYRVGYGQEEKR